MKTTTVLIALFTLVCLSITTSAQTMRMKTKPVNIKSMHVKKVDNINYHNQNKRGYIKTHEIKSVPRPIGSNSREAVDRKKAADFKKKRK